MIICAALLIQIEELDHETIVPCRRHSDGYKLLKDLGYAPKSKYKVISEGFISNEGKFFDRVQAYEHTLKCGQLSVTTRWYKADHKDNELYSEDLY